MHRFITYWFEGDRRNVYCKNRHPVISLPTNFNKKSLIHPPSRTNQIRSPLVTGKLTWIHPSTIVSRHLRWKSSTIYDKKRVYRIDFGTSSWYERVFKTNGVEGMDGQWKEAWNLVGQKIGYSWEFGIKTPPLKLWTKWWSSELTEYLLEKEKTF